MKIPPHIPYAIILIAIIFFIDQVSKEIILDLLYGGFLPIEVSGFINLVMVWNQGISFGMLAEHNASLLLAIVTSMIVIGIGVWLWRAEHYRLQIALSLLIGGAIGNIVDRLRYGAVVDFVDLHAFGYHWPAFNVADSAIVFGVIIMLWCNLTMDRKET